ncbi:hypothetical protein HDU87_006481 [Geranomyces variabilis]|uniref:Uncharacterized protein n=1 Tax=Geranomyces variabilis TaxID=109894 RepID=A0AAD5XL16_9FUNG|nr:hypothetical protein HDU87_006481 [Geranomyces variabilis]
MPAPTASSTSSSSKSTSSSYDTASPFYSGDPTYRPVRRRSIRLIERVARRFHLNFHDDHHHHDHHNDLVLVVPRDPETGRKIRSGTDATTTPQRASHHADTDTNNNRSSRRRPRSDSPPPPQLKGRRKSSLGLLSSSSSAPALPTSSSSSSLSPSPSPSPSYVFPHNDPVDLLALIESYSRPESLTASYGTTALPPPPRRAAGPARPTTRPTLRRRSTFAPPPPPPPQAFHRRPSYTLTSAAQSAQSAPLETPMSDISNDPFDHVMLDEDDEDAKEEKGTLHLLDHATAVGFDTLLFGDYRKTIKVSLTPTFIASAAR